jgi:hypothetical protein
MGIRDAQPNNAFESGRPIVWSAGSMVVRIDSRHISSLFTRRTAGINELRERLEREFPTKLVDVGRRFALCGEPAFRALTAYYYALTQADIERGLSRLRSIADPRCWFVRGAIP